MRIAIIHPNTTTIIDNNQTKISIEEIDSIETSSCISVHLSDCMDYVPLSERTKLLALAFSKVRKEGEITISGTDLLVVTHFIYNNIISMEQANTSLFCGRLSCDTVNNVIRTLESLGAKINNAKIDNMYYSIKANRPND